MANRSFKVELQNVKDETKPERKTPVLNEPLSELAKDMKVPIFDISAYVNRSTAERKKEVDQGKVPGKVMRPLNSFMLYRKAYKNLASEWCSQMRSNQCHQALSQVVGDSWRLESESVKDQFVELARVERVNHEKAHPDYKFSWGKQAAPKTVKRKRSLSVASSIEEEPVSPKMRIHEVDNSMPI